MFVRYVSSATRDFHSVVCAEGLLRVRPRRGASAFAVAAMCFTVAMGLLVRDAKKITALDEVSPVVWSQD